MRDDSIIALIENMPQMKDISCGKTSNNWIQKLIPYFGRNIESVYIESLCHFK
jgi:hypothetical protein